MKRTDLTNDEYRRADGIANSELKLIERNPSDIIWARHAPRDNSKAVTADFGTALHCLLLEPDVFNDLVLVSSVKGRMTKTFEEEQLNNPGNIVLTADEAEKVKIMAASVKAHPMANYLLSLDGDCESSVFAECPNTGILLKCRPDKDCSMVINAAIDVKTTASLDDWRSDLRWKNPLFAYDYGHQAAFYLHALSLHYGFDVENFTFIAVQKTVEMGRYPVGVFTVNREQLEAWGFWSRMLNNINQYSERTKANNWMESETFHFEYEHFDNDVEVVWEGDDNA